MYVAQAHQILCQRYPHLLRGDVMIPHTYTPLQTFFLTLICEEEALHEHPEETLTEYLSLFLFKGKVKLDNLTEELMSNPLVLAWCRDYMKGLSPEQGDLLLAALRKAFPFHTASLNMLKLVLKSMAL